jgi:hypothetical protein
MSDLKRIVDLANLLVTQTAAVAKMEDELKGAKRALQRIEQEDLPELMREVGMASVTLEDGSVIEVKEEVDCGISEERRPEAHKWLIDNGFGGLIKTEVVVAFGRGEQEAAEEFSAEVIQLTGQTPVVVERVHPATLKSFVKEQMEAGVTIPAETFALRPYSKAKLKPPKNR